jgi:hypothetical protein
LNFLMQRFTDEFFDQDVALCYSGKIEGKGLVEGENALLVSGSSKLHPLNRGLKESLVMARV